jgi:hypothetical protein
MLVRFIHEIVNLEMYIRNIIILHFDKIFVTAIDISADSCWFCLSSKKIAKHLIVSIGNQVFSNLSFLLEF